jgi:hypothetical protein
MHRPPALIAIAVVPTLLVPGFIRLQVNPFICAGALPSVAVLHVNGGAHVLGTHCLLPAPELSFVNHECLEHAAAAAAMTDFSKCQR